VDFDISPDSQRVIYRFQDGHPPYLYSKAINGSDEYLYNTNQFGTKETHSFSISPDGTRVVFIADEEVGSSAESLYSALVSGGPRTQLNDPATPVGSFYRISPDSSFVSFSANPVGEASSGAFRVPLAGGTQIQLNDPSIGNSGGALISPDSSRVVYTSSGDVYSVASIGGVQVKLNVGAPDLVPAHGAIISPNSSRVVFQAGSTSDGGTVDLYSSPLLGGGAVKLNTQLLQTGSRRIEDYSISPDSSYVVYLADKERIQTFNMYSVPINGGAVVKINEELQPLGDVGREYKISADSQRVVYVADQDPIDGKELYSVRPDGTDSVLLLSRAEDRSFDLAFNLAEGFDINSASTRVVGIRALSPRVFGRFQLFLVGIDGPLQSDSVCFVAKNNTNKLIPICL